MNKQTTGIRGDAALLFASSKLVEAGIAILKPVSECLKFDLVAYDNIKFDKLQIKRASPAKTKGKFIISLRSVTMTSKGAVAKKYTAADTDFIIGVVMETGDIYCMPISVLEGRTLVTLNPKNIISTNVNNKKFLNVEDYKNSITLNNKIYSL